MSTGAITDPFSDSGSDDEPAKAAMPDPLIGLTVAERYRIVGPIGAGGMGIVYRVEHIRIAKLMAMKLLAGELSRNPDIVKRFKREALLASRLSHHNTVQVFDFGQADGLTYLIMELVPGADLGRVLRDDGPFRTDRALRMMVQICGSVSEAHKQNIVHRDLKPENVLVMRGHDGKSEVAKVCDFGLAKLREQTEMNDVTIAGAVVGTPYYMSPEQIRGEEVDVRTDVYALGAVLYRLVTGTTPFTGKTPMAVFARHLTEAPQPPSQRTPGLEIPASINAIVMKALEKRPEDRFANAGELLEALMDELRRGPVSQVDMLLDSHKMRALANEVARAATQDFTQLAVGDLRNLPATRDEVDAYERKLDRNKRLLQASAVVLVGALAIGGYRAVRAATAAPSFDGVEHEPNDDAPRAEAVPFGETVTGFVGKRISKSASDTDFYALEVPPHTGLASLKVTALPNLRTCTWMYRAGTPEPMARYCSGEAGRDLVIDALRVEPGRYLFAELQDLDGYEDDAPAIVENVSDSYALTFGPPAAAQGNEIEPNDTPQAATRVVVGSDVTARLSFVRDVDVFCADPSNATGKKLRWKITDNAARELGQVIEATMVKGPREGAIVHVHRPGATFKATAIEAASPWSSDGFTLDGSPTYGCLQVRLGKDASAPTHRVSAGTAPYVVRLEEAP